MIKEYGIEKVASNYLLKSMNGSFYDISCNESGSIQISFEINFSKISNLTENINQDDHFFILEDPLQTTFNEGTNFE